MFSVRLISEGELLGYFTTSQEAEILDDKVSHLNFSDLPWNYSVISHGTTICTFLHCSKDF